jgi:hypothetical protein
MDADRSNILVELERRRQEAIRRAFMRLDAVALGAGVGLTAALGLFVGTAVLLIKDAGQAAIGPNLAVLGHYLPGFSVTWAGAAVGAVDAAVVGFLAGFLIAAVRTWALRFVLWKAAADQNRWRRRHLLDEI